MTMTKIRFLISVITTSQVPKYDTRRACTTGLW